MCWEEVLFVLPDVSTDLNEAIFAVLKASEQAQQGGFPTTGVSKYTVYAGLLYIEFQIELEVAELVFKLGVDSHDTASMLNLWFML